MSSREEPQQAIKAGNKALPKEVKKDVLVGEPVSTGLTALACVLAWAVPGMGHIILHRYKRGILFMVAILAMFVLGLVMRGHLYIPTLSDKLSIFPSFANVGVGLPYFICLLIHTIKGIDLGFGVPQAAAATFEYGNTFLWTAGLLNYLVILDVFDIAVGRKK